MAALGFSAITGTKTILAFDDGDLSVWTASGIALLGALVLLAHRRAWADELKRAPVVSGKPDELERANVRWLSEQGSVVIVTRDMSWSIGAEVQRALETKARAGDLTIFANVMTPSLAALRDAGARLMVLEHAPLKVRFTILRWRTTDSRVLLHRQSEGRVEFFELTPADFPGYWFAHDIVELLDRVTSDGRSGD